MRAVADKARIEAFLTGLAREATGETDVFLVGGTSAVLDGWRASTVDIDLVMRPESDERGHGRDLADVEAMLARGLISGAQVRAMYSRMEPELYRFPAIDPPSFRRAVDVVFPA